MSRRVPVTIEVLLDDDQERQWAALRNLVTGKDGIPAAKITSDDVRAFALATVKGSPLGLIGTVQMAKR